MHEPYVSHSRFWSKIEVVRARITAMHLPYLLVPYHTVPVLRTVYRVPVPHQVQYKSRDRPYRRRMMTTKDEDRR